MIFINDDKKKACICSEKCDFFWNILQLKLVKSIDRICNMEGWLNPSSKAAIEHLLCLTWVWRRVRKQRSYVETSRYIRVYDNSCLLLPQLLWLWVSPYFPRCWERSTEYMSTFYFSLAFLVIHLLHRRQQPNVFNPILPPLSRHIPSQVCCVTFLEF